MNKRDLVEKIADKSSLSNADAERALSALVEAITESVANGDKVTVPDFGTFEKRERSARTGRNPQTGESIDIAATSVPGFKAGTAFKKRVAG
ncbi:HU family DNA-binding protein [Nocardioides mesophilus]|uniref:HU family DNA-binding protein n=1 Tax=Nocardioides mesophilus TaxID=433659 RepID=A0A7G9RCK5_9ACTN|nr:HU family DNA-binding protein [Nocardioides mesophilus]QNN53330.1 HU family DNA-binding protein [Nocardioides mesophilus]